MRQTYKFNLDDRHVNGQTDGRTTTTTAHPLGYIMLFIGYLHVRKEAYRIRFHNLTVCPFGRRSVLSLNRSPFAPVQIYENITK